MSVLAQQVPFMKMHGSGNDFVVVLEHDLHAATSDERAFTTDVCKQGTGIGADGVLVIGPSENHDFSWRYINADGTDGDMCGNGAMVGARYALEQGLAGNDCAFETASGPVHAIVDGAKVELDMIDATWLGDGYRFDAMPGVEFARLMIGVPHVVAVVPDADAVSDLDTIGRTIRYDAQLQPDGANVNLIHRTGDNSIRMRTYERGVEAETLACGTGSVCSAVTAVRRGLVQQPVTVRVSSGMDLHVSWQEDGDRITGVRLRGNTAIVASGVIHPNAFT